MYEFWLFLRKCTNIGASTDVPDVPRRTSVVATQMASYPLFLFCDLLFFFIFDAEVDWRLSTAYLVCRGRLSRSLTSCFSLNTVS